MKRLFVILAAALTLASCETRVQDVPEISVEQSEYSVSSTGGTMIIPVYSTGIDDVRVSYKWHSDEWETNENGDMTPKEGWCKVVKVINDYQVTRDLPAWLSGLQIEIKPNEVAAERTAYVTASSFTKSVVITINQTAKME